jgi:hypothetical protein
MSFSQLVLVWKLCWSEKAIKILILGFQEVTALFVHRKTIDFPTSWNYILLLLASSEGQTNWPVCPKVALWGRCFQKCTEMFLKAPLKASLEIAHICIHVDWMGLYSSEIAHLHAYWFNTKNIYYASEIAQLHYLLIEWELHSSELAQFNHTCWLNGIVRDAKKLPKAFVSLPAFSQFWYLVGELARSLTMEQ